MNESELKQCWREEGGSDPPPGLAGLGNQCKLPTGKDPFLYTFHHLRAGRMAQMVRMLA
jgi:hypothetical protein